MNIGGTDIGPGYPCRVVAEISSNHMGSEGRALQLIAHAKAAGADFVKMQCYSVPEILDLRGDGHAPAPWEAYTKRDLYTIGQTPYDWFPGLFRYARHLGIVPFSTVLGRESLVILEREQCPAYKLSSYEAGQVWLQDAILETGKPLIISRHDPLPPEIRHHQILTLYCPPGYPTSTVTPFISGYDGASLHTTNADVVLLAAQAGAHLVEVHLMLDWEEYETAPLDAAFSYTPNELSDLITRIHSL